MKVLNKIILKISKNKKLPNPLKSLTKTDFSCEKVRKVYFPWQDPIPLEFNPIQQIVGIIFRTCSIGQGLSQKNNLQKMDEQNKLFEK